MKVNKEIQTKISLLRRRLYRFCNDEKQHVLIEELENKLYETHLLNSTISQIEKNLKTISGIDESDWDYENIASEEDIDLELLLKERKDFDSSELEFISPLKVIFIVGSPRSGTTYLYNLLSSQNHFAYFTNISHHIWPLYNLSNLKHRKIFFKKNQDINQIDTKELRIRADIVFPDEAEQIFNRAIPLYKRMASHTYSINNPIIDDKKLLHNTMNKHLLFFDKRILICKSPFNSFRINELQKIFKDKAYFLHIHRNGYAASQSIKSNKFKYYFDNKELDDPALFWAKHIEAVENLKSNTNMLELKLDSLHTNQKFELDRIYHWLGLSNAPTIFEGKYQKENRSLLLKKNNKLIDKYNALLGY